MKVFEALPGQEMLVLFDEEVQSNESKNFLTTGSGKKEKEQELNG